MGALQRMLAVAAAAIVATVLVDAVGLLTAAQESATDALAPDVEVGDGFVVLGLDRRFEQAGVTLPSAPNDPLRDDDGELTATGQAALLVGLLRAGATTVVYATVPDLDDFGDFVEQVDAAGPTLRQTGRVLVPTMVNQPVEVASTPGARSNELATFTARVLPFLEVEGGVRTHAILATPAAGDATRFVPLVLPQREGPPYLAVTVAAAALQDGATATDLADARYGDRGLRVGPLEVGDGGRGGLRIAWSSDLVEGVAGTTTQPTQAAPYVSATEVIDYVRRLDRAAQGEGRGPAGANADAAVAAVEGRVVIVGDVQPDTATYLRVPGGPAAGIPEVWVHANAFNTVRTGTFLTPEPAWQSLVALVLLAVAGTFLLSALPMLVGAAAVVGLLAVHVALGAVRLGGGTIPDLVHPLAALVLASAAAVTTRAVMEARHRQQVAGLFSQYVPEEVARQLLHDLDRAEHAAEGERVHVSVLFADLRGFTRMAAGLDPPRVKDILNVYYRHATGLILDAGGTVMQFVGDEVFAVFGAPLPMDDHAERALAVARALQDARDTIAEELASMDLPAIDYGIGIQSGEGVAAHVGDQARRQYGIVGDTVNVGARLCSQAGVGEIVISEDVIALLPQPPDVVDLGAVQMKGIDRDLAVFRVVR